MEKRSKVCQRVGLILTLLCVLYLTSEAQTSPEVLFKDDFSSGLDTSIWKTNTNFTTVKSGTIAVDVGNNVRYCSNLLLCQKPFSFFNEEGLTFEIVLAGFHEYTNKVGGFHHDARIFLTPTTEGWLEPYTLPNTLHIVVEYNEGSDSLISLYTKVDMKDGYGSLLWKGFLTSSSFPLGIQLWLNQNQYKLSFDKTVETDSGLKDGYHKLPKDVWNKEVWFGIRSVNIIEGYEGTVLIDRFSVSVMER